jgi:DNA polymerase-3 subunit delta
MSSTRSALDFLALKRKPAIPGVCVLFGSEAFLKRLVLAELRRLVLGEDGGFGETAIPGDDAGWLDIADELATYSLFGPSRRMVVIENADEFVSKHRPELEDYAASPSSTGVLVLEVSTWPKTTRLYKAVDQSGLQIECTPPGGVTLRNWLVTWCAQQHGATLSTAAAEELIELAGPEMGLLDQELAKLAAYAGPDGNITPDIVRQLVGGWRAKTTWDMLDAACSGDAPAALDQLDRLLNSGQDPVAILAAAGYVFRKIGAAARLVEHASQRGSRISLGQALAQAGVKPFAIAKTEAQMKQIGRQRATRLYQWLVQADLDLKGGSSLPPRVVLERLIVRLSKRAAPKQA